MDWLGESARAMLERIDVLIARGLEELLRSERVSGISLARRVRALNELLELRERLMRLLEERG